MSAEFKEFKGDETAEDFVWGVVCVIGFKRIAIKLNGKETQFGVKHLLQKGKRTPAQHKLYRDSNTYPTIFNTVIVYDGPSDFQRVIEEIADAFFGQRTCEPDPKNPRKLVASVEFSKRRVVPVMGITSNDLFTGYSVDTVKIKAELKGTPGDSISIVLVHLDPA